MSLKKWFANLQTTEKELEFLENDIVQRLLKSNEEVMKRLIATSNQSLTKKVSRMNIKKHIMVIELISRWEVKSCGK